ncbi:hypothetical protein J6590_043247 [Homalodisca vitripennis]|nr:hypothetical protein J6590_043247 [Homalodisca vitripennis]
MAVGDVFSDASFLFLFVAMICNIVSLVLWVIPDNKDNAMGFSRAKNCLFAHTVPAYMIVLIGMVLLHCLGERPGQCFSRLFLGAGFFLFIITGVLGLINCLKDGNNHTSFAMIISILCIVCAVLLLVDLLKSEGMF